MLRGLVEEVELRAEAHGDRRDELLPDGVQRRVAHLREELLEVAEQQLRTVREHRQRRVVAHRPDRLAAAHRHRLEQHAQLLGRVAEGLLEVDQVAGADSVVAVEARVGVGERVEVDSVVPEPLAVGLRLRQLRLDGRVVDDAAALRVQQEHAAGVDALLEQDLLRRYVQHADLGGHDEAVVGRDEIAERPQAVAVEHRADAVAVGEGDEGGPVPRLHRRGVVVVEVPLLLRHPDALAGGLRYQRHHHVVDGPPRVHHELEGVVDARRVALPRPDDREELGHVVAEQRRGHGGLAGDHPVDVPAQRVDLAVVDDVPVRVRQLPGP